MLDDKENEIEPMGGDIDHQKTWKTEILTFISFPSF